MKNTITILLLTLLALPVFGQFKMTPPEGMERPAISDKSAIQINADGINATTTPNTMASTPYATLPSIALTKAENLKIYRDPKTDQPVWIKGIPENMDRSKTSLAEKAFAYLEAIREVINIDQPEKEFSITSTQTDEQGRLHLRLQQSLEGIKIYGSEIMLHSNANDIQLFNGRYFPTPQLDIRQRNITQAQAEETVKTEITNETTLVELSPEALKLVDGEPLKSSLMIYHPDNNLEQPRLVWHVEIIPNITSRWEYFIDANTGEVLFHHKNICQLFGWHEDHEHHNCTAKNSIISDKPLSIPDAVVVTEETAVANDLNNVSRQFSVWRDGNNWLMVDASRNMYNAAQSNLPDAAVGVIGTFDANNTYPGQGSSINIVNHGNNSSWTRNEVSAHYNAGIAYEYFRTVFGRNSIKDQGENIFSVVNVSDENGNDMDNAFWNGETMFYGNGNQAFNAPLAKALDVAGHEMAHGVVQSTANLVYQNEAGALNESFADIFGAMIDREDWQIGEEVANPSVFPSGTMRDMANPNNGGNSNNFFWQPAHYNERFTGSEDNGGVHINSGIPNHAYYLFATTSGIGKAKAEQIFYKALDDYLVMSSQFVDLRIAVIQAATDIHGNGSAEVAAAATAFDAVGILGEDGGDYEIDVEANTGDNFILWSDDNLSNINTSDIPDLTTLGAFTADNHISRPSISDDGTELTYVHSDGSLRFIEIDWSSGSPEVTDNFNLNNTSTWRNIVVSKDGTKVAALFGDLSQNEFDNEILIFDFISGEGQWFPLSNPTTANGLSTGDVLYADAMEFDITGEFLLYDAFNQIPSSFGEDIEYWDIGVLKVWDNNSNSFANSVDPQISKIFNNLGENVSVGNATFAKNSPYVIAFDHIEAGLNGTNYSVYGVNIQTGEQGVIFDGNKPGYPSYSIDDDFVMFSINNSGLEILAAQGINPNKTEADANSAFILIENATWGAWYAIGERDLVATDDLLTLSTEFSVLPNPSAGRLNLRYTGTKSTEATVKLYDGLGQLIGQKRLNIASQSTTDIFDISDSPSGSYVLQITTSEGQVAKRVVKQ